ncbi:CD63 antigen-like [Polypterus senegalus]|uniref:CD63 antigen-like n=1 Tax=Polypterus senegalus TaxID=55291 RepID=UPI001963FFCE|nr:CD63 antigen-like [Polypterus senegalus]
MGKEGCVTFLLITFNLVFWASGVALIVIGAVSHVSYGHYTDFTGSGLSHAAIVLIVVGLVVAIISFLGCFGTWKKEVHVLQWFTALLILVLVVELLAGIVLYALRSKVEQKLRKQARQVIREYSASLWDLIDDIQFKFHCCGADNYTDWFASPGWRNNGSVPDSCCLEWKENCGRNTTERDIYQQGCVDAFKGFLKKNLAWVTVACTALALFEILGAVLGCLAFSTRSSYQHMK